MKQVGLPRLFQGKGAEDQVRVCVPGSRPGEGQYLLALLLVEYGTEE